MTSLPAMSRHQQQRYKKGQGKPSNIEDFNDELPDKKTMDKFNKMEELQFESPPNAAKINFQIKPVKALSLAMKQQ